MMIKKLQRRYLNFATSVLIEQLAGSSTGQIMELSAREPWVKYSGGFFCWTAVAIAEKPRVEETHSGGGMASEGQPNRKKTAASSEGRKRPSHRGRRCGYWRRGLRGSRSGRKRGNAAATELDPLAGVPQDHIIRVIGRESGILLRATETTLAYRLQWVKAQSPAGIRRTLMTFSVSTAGRISFQNKKSLGSWTCDRFPVVLLIELRKMYCGYCGREIIYEEGSSACKCAYQTGS